MTLFFIVFLTSFIFKSESILFTSSKIFWLAFLATSSQICSMSAETYQSVNSANLSKSSLVVGLCFFFK